MRRNKTMKTFMKWFIAFSMGFAPKTFKLIQSIGKTEFWQVTIFILLTIILTIGWKFLLDRAYED